jgi:diketogulonate reductase-like aldo/keto reductase
MLIMSAESAIYNSNEIPHLTSLADCVRLNNGVMMPRLGIGTWFDHDRWTGLENDIELAVTSILAGIKAGYRAIDTAYSYGTEPAIGIALREGAFKREEIFITSKYMSLEMGYDDVFSIFDETLSDMNTEYLDLYLIHWAKLYPDQDVFVDVWKAFEKLYKDGRVRAIGVSNFTKEHLERLFNETEIVPAVHQIELNPFFQQKEMRAFCMQHGIQVEAWTILGYGRIFYNETIKTLAKKYKKTETQITVRWALQQGIITMTRAEREDWLIENGNVFDFEISKEDMALLETLNTNQRIGADPNDGPIGGSTEKQQKP